MNVCEVPDVCKNMEYKLVTEDSKTRVYLSVVREFNEAEYEKYCIRKKKEKVRKRILFIASPSRFPRIAIRSSFFACKNNPYWSCMINAQLRNVMLSMPRSFSISACVSTILSLDRFIQSALSS